MKETRADTRTALLQALGLHAVLFALMFAAIAKDPQKNRGLIPYGILLKLSYCGVIGAHWLGSGIPRMWKPFAVGDFIFMLLFAGAWLALAKPAEPAQT